MNPSGHGDTCCCGACEALRRDRLLLVGHAAAALRDACDWGRLADLTLEKMSAMLAREWGETMTFDECCVTLATKTKMDRDEWADFLSLSPDAQSAAAQAYRDASWVRSPDTLAAVLAVLAVAAQVAGAVSGIAGAATALQTLKL